MRTDAFLAGARCLAEMGLTLDIWALHTQLGDIVEFARTIPELPIVIDHCGGPIGVGPYANQREQVFADWSAGLRQAAALPNLNIKLSGLGMARLGFRGDPAKTSDELAAKWKPYVQACVEAFGPERSIFASNFPVDKVAGSYPRGGQCLQKDAGGSAGERVEGDLRWQCAAPLPAVKQTTCRSGVVTSQSGRNSHGVP